MATLTRHHVCRAIGLLVTVGLGGCTNESARAPNPPGYDWPDEFSYQVEDVAETLRDAQVVARREEKRTLRFGVRDDRYLVWNDGVATVQSNPGSAPQGGRLDPADTLHYYLRLTRLGEFNDVEPGCDPAVSACHDVLPSALPLELRRVIPRLPVWWPPKGHQWVDTLRFDDLPRPGAARGLLITTYRDGRDTAIAGRKYWRVTWKSVKAAARLSNGAMVADPDVEAYGNALVDKDRLIPVLTSWYGTLAAPPASRAAGVTATAIRGRAWLAGGGVDSAKVGP
jgi:hypothetical protein